MVKQTVQYGGTTQPILWRMLYSTTLVLSHDAIIALEILLLIKNPHENLE